MLDVSGTWAWWTANSEAIQALATTLALLVGAFWAVWLFFHRRERVPHLNVEHRVAHWRVNDSIVVHVAARVTNVGTTIARLRSGRAWVQHVLPTPTNVVDCISRGDDPVPAGESEIPWHLAHESSERACDWSSSPQQVEPGESEEYIFDFVISSTILAVQVYSHFKNDAKRGNVGWNTTTLHFVRAHDGKDAAHDGTGSSEAETAGPGEGKVEEQMAKTGTFTRQGTQKPTPAPPPKKG